MFSNSEYHVIDNEGIVKVHEVINNYPNQENFYTLEYDVLKEKWNVYSIARTDKRLLKSFYDKNFGYFALAVIIIKYTTSPKIIKPDLPDRIYTYNDNDIFRITMELNTVLKNNYYSIYQHKINAVNLYKEDGFYLVSYIDLNNFSYIISDDNEEFADGLNILYNFAWYLHLLDRLTLEWFSTINKDNLDYQEVVKLILGI